MQSARMLLIDFHLFGAAVWHIARSGPLICESWSRHFFDNDEVRLQPGEQLTTGLTAPEQNLAMLFEVT